MLFCSRCQKEVVLYSVSLGAATDQDLSETRRHFEQEGKLVLFNPPPLGPYHCPVCGTECSRIEAP